MNPDHAPDALLLLLIRHAQTAENRDGIVQGRADNPLSDLGLQQAGALAESLANIRLRAMYASPLMRARQTADAVASRQGLAVTVEPDLIEMDIGALEGLRTGELRERYPDFLRAWTSEQAGDVPMPAGESLQQVQERAGAALERIIVDYPEGTVAVISHNFVVLTLICRFLSLPLHQFRRLRHHVAGVTMIEVAPGRRTLKCFNDICHLERMGLLGDDPWQSQPRP